VGSEMCIRDSRYASRRIVPLIHLFAKSIARASAIFAFSPVLTENANLDILA